MHFALVHSSYSVPNAKMIPEPYYSEAEHDTKTYIYVDYLGEKNSRSRLKI
jgi:hypothetical protein